MKVDEPKLYFLIESPTDEHKNYDWKLQTHVMELFLELKRKGYKMSLTTEGFDLVPSEGNIAHGFYIPQSLFEEWNK